MDYFTMLLEINYFHHPQLWVGFKRFNPNLIRKTTFEDHCKPNNYLWTSRLRLTRVSNLSEHFTSSWLQTEMFDWTHAAIIEFEDINLKSFSIVHDNDQKFIIDNCGLGVKRSKHYSFLLEDSNRRLLSRGMIFDAFAEKYDLDLYWSSSKHTYSSIVDDPLLMSTWDCESTCWLKPPPIKNIIYGTIEDYQFVLEEQSKDNYNIF